MKDHIMHNEVVYKIKLENNTNAKAISDKIKEAIKPIRNISEEVSTWDECIIVCVYVRKWNDVITTWLSRDMISTSWTALDYNDAKNSFSWMLDNRTALEDY